MGVGEDLAEEGAAPELARVERKERSFEVNLGTVFWKKAEKAGKQLTTMPVVISAALRGCEYVVAGDNARKGDLRPKADCECGIGLVGAYAVFDACNQAENAGDGSAAR